MSTVSDDRRRAEEARAALLAESMRRRHQVDEVVRAEASQSVSAQLELREEAVFKAAVQAALDDGLPQLPVCPVEPDEPPREDAAAEPADAPLPPSPSLSLSPLRSSSHPAAPVTALHLPSPSTDTDPRAMPASSPMPAREPARGAPPSRARPSRAPVIASASAAAPTRASIAEQRPAAAAASRPVDEGVPQRVQPPMPRPAATRPTRPTPPVSTPARPADPAVASDFEAGWREARAVVHDAPRAVDPPGDEGRSARQLFEQGLREGATLPAAPVRVFAPVPAPVRQASVSGDEAHVPTPAPPSPSRAAAPSARPAPGRVPSRSTAPSQPPPSSAVPIATLQQMLEPRTVLPGQDHPAVATAAPPNPMSQASLDFWRAYAQELPPGHELRAPLEQAVQAQRSATPPAADATPSQVRRDDERDDTRLEGAGTLAAAQQALDAHLALLTPALQLAKAT